MILKNLPPEANFIHKESNTVVVQDIFDEVIRFTLEFWLANYMYSICIYALVKIPRFAW